MRFRKVAAKVLAGRHLPWQAALLAVVLMSPALALGWQLDDYIHRAALNGLPELSELERSPLELFEFVRGGETDLKHGLWPWWSAESLRLSFFRPVAGLSHWLDYALWPSSPAAMHLHSLFLFGLSVFAAAGLYRRLMGPTAVAGLAILLFALDDAHAIPAGWLANRNATLAALFGFMSLLAHDRWRRDGWRLGAVAAPACLLLAVLANEAAVGLGGYLLAYGLFLDRGGRRAGLVSLAPCAATGLAWSAVYRLLGHGAAGSFYYIDPVGATGDYLRAVVERLPVLVRAQWAIPAADFDLVLSESMQSVAWWLSLTVTGVVVVLLAPLVRRDATARFWAVGAALAVLPACATFPANRLLFLFGLGSMGLLGQLVAALWRSASRQRVGGLAAGGIAVLFLVVHLLLSPLSVPFIFRNLQSLGAGIEQAALSLPAAPGAGERSVVIVNAPSTLFTFYAPILQALEPRPIPRRTLVLGTSIYSVEVERRGARTLLLRPRGGYLPLPGSSPPGEEGPAVDPRYIFQMFDLFFCDRGSRFAAGECLDRTDPAICITAVGAGGRPTEVSFRFARPLEDPSLVWLEWRDGLYEPFALPAAGETTTLAPARVPR